MESNIHSDQLITEDQLKAWSRYSRTADLLDFLRSNGIMYFRGRGGSVMTTIQAVNAPLKGTDSKGTGENKSQEWE